MDSAGGVSALYYKSNQLFQMRFDFSMGWSAPIAVFATDSKIVAAKSNASGSIIAGDDKGNLYYYDAGSSTLYKRYFGFVLIDQNGLAIDQNGTAMVAQSYFSVLYRPNLGWTGVHLLPGASNYYFASGFNTTLAGSNGVFHGFHWQPYNSSSNANDEVLYQDTLFVY